MRITQSTTPLMKNAEVMALLCAFAQLALAVGLFWAFKDTSCLTSNKTGGKT